MKLIFAIIGVLLLITACTPSQDYCETDADCVPYCFTECANAEWTEKEGSCDSESSAHGQLPSCLCIDNVCKAE